jgi:hypothetical protein
MCCLREQQWLQALYISTIVYKNTQICIRSLCRRPREVCMYLNAKKDAPGALFTRSYDTEACVLFRLFGDLDAAGVQYTFLISTKCFVDNLPAMIAKAIVDSSEASLLWILDYSVQRCKIDKSKLDSVLKDNLSQLARHYHVQVVRALLKDTKFAETARQRYQNQGVDSEMSCIFWNQDITSKDTSRVLSCKIAILAEIIAVNPGCLIDDIMAIVYKRWQYNDLRLDRCELKLMPERMCWVHIAGNLDLSYNLLKSLPERFGDITIEGTLHLDSNQLESLPERFGDIMIKGGIHLCNNCLVSLPENFGNMMVKGGIDLGYNLLELLPKGFGDITYLGYLYLSHNCLKTLPESFSKLQIQTTLCLKGNLLKSLPENFSDIKVGDDIDLEENLLILPPKNIGNQGSKVCLWSDDLEYTRRFDLRH